MPLVRRSRSCFFISLKRSVFCAVFVLRAAPRSPSPPARRRPPCSPGARRGSLAPPRLTTMWPISPAAPRPSQGLPSRISPPPTPVPQKTPSSGRRACRRRGGTRPRSRPGRRCRPGPWCRAPLRALSASGKLPSQPGRLRALRDDAGLLVGVAGRADPDARQVAGSRPRPARPPRASRRPSRSATSSGPPSVGVGRRDSPRTLPRASTTAVWILVPPRSMPPRSSAAGSAAFIAPPSRAVPRADLLSLAGGPYFRRLWKARPMAELPGWRLWWEKRRWYERNRRPRRRWRINRHMARARRLHPLSGRGRGARGARRGPAADRQRDAARAGLLDHDVARGRDRDRRGLLPQPQHDARRPGADRDRRPRDVRQRLLRRRRRAHRFDDPDTPITWQGFTSKGPVRIGSNCWFGVNCVVTSGVTIGERCVIGANSVVTEDLPPRTIAAGAPAKVIREIEFRRLRGGGGGVSLRGGRCRLAAAMARDSSTLGAGACGGPGRTVGQ